MNSKIKLSMIIAFSSSLITSACSSSSDTKSLYSAPLESEETLLNEGMRAYDRQLYSLARDNFEDLIDGYPVSYWTTLAELKTADSYFFGEDYLNAIAKYEAFILQHPGHEALDYARFMIGVSYLRQYRNEKKDHTPIQLSIKKFRELLKAHPNSVYVPQARRYINRCRELLAQNELDVAQFYIKQEQVDAAKSRLQYIIDVYPDTDQVTQARVLISQLPKGDALKSKSKLKAEPDSDVTPQIPDVIRTH